jgi:hypothetical protein
MYEIAGDDVVSESGQTMQKYYLSERGFRKFMMMAPRQDVANAVHDYYLDLEERYLNGDLSLIREIVANHDAVNAASSSPTVTLAQTTTVPAEESATLPVVHAQGAVLNAVGHNTLQPKKRKLEDLDPIERLEYDERVAALKDRIRDRDRAFALQVLQDLTDLGMATDVDKLRTADLIRNSTLGIITVNPNSDEPNRHLVSNINISRVTAELGYTSTVSSDTAIGIALSNLYRKTHGERPKKVPVHCNGQVRHLCNYTENERVMMEQCIREYFEKR